LRAGWAYFVSFQQSAKDFAELSQTWLTMPVLAIGGEKANGEVLGQQVKIVATDATMVVQRCRNLSAASCRQASASRSVAIRFSLLVSMVSNDTAHIIGLRECSFFGLMFLLKIPARGTGNKARQTHETRAVA